MRLKSEYIQKTQQPTANKTGNSTWTVPRCGSVFLKKVFNLANIIRLIQGRLKVNGLAKYLPPTPTPGFFLWVATVRKIIWITESWILFVCLFVFPFKEKVLQLHFPRQPELYFPNAQSYCSPCLINSDEKRGSPGLSNSLLHGTGSVRGYPEDRPWDGSVFQREEDYVGKPTEGHI